MTSRPASTAAAVAAAVTGLIAFVLVLAGLGLLWANGHFKDGDGYVGTGAHHLATGTRALTAGNLDVEDPTWARAGWGSVRLRATGSAPLFVGVARTADVDRYLRGVARSRLTDVDLAPFRAHYALRPGTRAPAAPASQDFWLASAHGAGAQTLDWKPTAGDWSLVVMNEDGSPQVSASVSAAAKLPFLTALAWSVLGAGLLFVLATGVLMLFATRPAAPRAVAVA